MSIDQEKYRTGRHVVYSLQAHVVLVTKCRRGAITDRVREHLIATTHDVCERFETTLVEADGEDDHLHLLVDYPPKVSLSKLVGAIKTNTSLWVRRENFPEVTQALWGDHFWSPSYFVTSTGGASLEKVAAYVRDQREPSRAPGKPKQQPR
ncbi:IS200/IS605 family transposase [Rhodococcus sp. OK302]|uniref:IS200/IS605 family transposase n=1 Tax=Rhodococcus sp. OK302 TaxID=1882769 RepID=UPI000B93FFB7|nr:IS200/IS605 family transposase [Rhodococcus sp. OK302]OYD67263.1 putative transposase [Rhodococcus sp. OK302]